MLNKVSEIDSKAYVINLAKTVLEKEIDGLLALKLWFSDPFVKTVEKITNLRGRVIVSGMGKSGHIARKIASTLSSTGTPAFFVHPAEASHGDLGMITEDDLVLLLSNSGESEELNNILDYCKRFLIPVVGISRKSNSTLMMASEIALTLPDTPEASNISAPTTSTTMMIALGDALAVVLYEKRGFSHSDFKILHPGGKIGAKLIKVKELMHTKEAIPLAYYYEPATKAILEMTSKRLGCVGIIDENGKLLGVFTDGDLRRHIEHDLKTIRIEDIMTKNPKVITKDAFASEALGIMNKKAITNLFVVEDSKPVGVIHMHDILRAKIV
jgi:arabinose-5-phosphate isomerase